MQSHIFITLCSCNCYPNMNKTCHLIMLLIKHSKNEEKSESLLSTPTSFISTNSGCIVVECMPSLWKNSLTFSAIFIYSDKFLHLKKYNATECKNKLESCARVWWTTIPVLTSLTPYILTLGFQHFKITRVAISIINKSQLCLINASDDLSHYAAFYYSLFIACFSQLISFVINHPHTSSC